MKAKVLKKFRDKHTGKIRKVGTVFEVSEERFAEIRNTDESLVEAVEEKAEETATEDTATEEKAEETATEDTATEEKAEEKKPAKKAKTK